ncbi:unnamed protein product [Pleuronectes platessa]|uniref:Uncharacterized protein n=1 Tax=Pleuronectes platessa TaxID=8262 RepID=A0A9N7U345_PLEPL|nr:unnamed protein product [Pleuronectes platessa]
MMQRAIVSHGNRMGERQARQRELNLLTPVTPAIPSPPGWDTSGERKCHGRGGEQLDREKCSTATSDNRGMSSGAAPRKQLLGHQLSSSHYGLMKAHTSLLDFLATDCSI